MNLFEYVIPFIVALGALIFFHELGHYLVARWCGVKVLRFSVGFGKPLMRWTAGPDRTEWVVAAFPLGGYVKMLDEREGEVDVSERDRAFNRQSVWRRYAIVAAGPLANFLLAIVLYWGLFSTGTEELRPRLALTEAADTIAVRGGVQNGDLVLEVQGEGVRSWAELRWTLLRHVLDQREVSLRVRTAENVETFRMLDLSGVRIDDGRVDLIDQIGLRPWRPHVPAEVGQVMSGSPAEHAGIRPGDVFLLIDEVEIGSWFDLVDQLRDRGGERLDIVVRRDGIELRLNVTPETTSDGGQRVARIGIAMADASVDRDEMFAVVQYGLIESVGKAVVKTWDTSVFVLKSIGRMFTGDVSWKNLSGPVTIADYAGQTAKLGLAHYLGFLALISISLGVLNLLPIPVLDGGHLLYYTIEIIKGGPVSERAMVIGQQIGLVALVMLMAVAFYNDIARLISG